MNKSQKKKNVQNIWTWPTARLKFHLELRSNCGNNYASSPLTYLSCVFGEGPYKCCKIFYTILCFVFVIICMLALNVSLIPMTLTMCPYDCKLNMKRAMFYPKFVYYMIVTRPPISSYHHRPFAMKFPHIMANDSIWIHLVSYRWLFWFQQECLARRQWSNWTENGNRRKLIYFAFANFKSKLDYIFYLFSRRFYRLTM